MNERTYEVNEAKGQFINYRIGQGEGFWRPKNRYDIQEGERGEVLGTDEIVNSCANYC